MLNRNLACNCSKIARVFLFLSVIICEISSSGVLRPRGVSLSRASLYPPDKDFVCFDGSLTIPFSHVNDDYCDCPDASDEPGTAACPHGTFHCTNAGHRPLNIASSHVNDGICDCCDASDEYATTAESKCVNNCNELGKSARVEAQRRAELIKMGSQVRAEMGKQGVLLKQEKKEKLVELQKSRVEAEQVQKEKQSIKAEIEELENAALEQYRKIEENEKRIRQEEENAKNRAEATDAFQRFDSNQDGRIELIELQSRQTFDQNRDGEVTEEEAKFFLNDQPYVELQDWISSSWEKVRPFLMLDQGMFKPPATPEPPTAADDEEEHYEEEEDEDSYKEGDDGYEGEADEVTEESGPEKDDPTEVKPTYDEETQKIIDRAGAARSDHSEAERTVRDIQSEITQIEETLLKDYGLDEEFAPLDGHCFDYTDREYIYKLCPFDKTTQTPKSGGADTRLGTWGRWSGPEENMYESMLFDRGNSCWNGPQRSSQVRVTCGSENVVMSVSEPNRCEYLFEFSTPAACKDTGDVQEDLHDEL